MPPRVVNIPVVGVAFKKMIPATVQVGCDSLKSKNLDISLRPSDHVAVGQRNLLVTPYGLWQSSMWQIAALNWVPRTQPYFF